MQTTWSRAHVRNLRFLRGIVLWRWQAPVFRNLLINRLEETLACGGFKHNHQSMCTHSCNTYHKKYIFLLLPFSHFIMCTSLEGTTTPSSLSFSTGRCKQNRNFEAPIPPKKSATPTYNSSYLPLLPSVFGQRWTTYLVDNTSIHYLLPGTICITPVTIHAPTRHVTRPSGS